MTDVLTDLFRTGMLEIAFNLGEGLEYQVWCKLLKY